MKFRNPHYVYIFCYVYIKSCYVWPANGHRSFIAPLVHHCCESRRCDTISIGAVIKVLVFCFGRKLLYELVTSLSHGVLLTHEKLIQEHKSSLTQNRALQILFDLRLMMSIFMGRGETEGSEISKRLEQIEDALESCVDPFDLDVFSPHMATNLNRQLQRCGVCRTIQHI